MHNTTIIGWDVGGAHLKAACVQNGKRVTQVFQRACPLWLGLEQLAAAVDSIMADLPQTPKLHAVTMTGELADIFPNRSEGVRQIIACMQERLGGSDLSIYAGPHGFVPAVDSHRYAAAIASGNWHASASFLAAQLGAGLFMDIGSTTSDILLLQDGIPTPRGYSDAERLQYEELVYTGVIRTPIMAVAQSLPFQGEPRRLAAEHFATMADVYRLTGELPDLYDMADTADGKGKSAEESARRLARMIGHDLEDADMNAWRQLAEAIRSRQLETLRHAAERQLSRGMLTEAVSCVGAGAGAFLVRELARQMKWRYLDASALFESAPEVAEWAGVCLPAYAVAWLSARGARC